MSLFRWSVSFASALLLAPSLLAAEPGQASGTVTIDGKATTLAFAYSHPEEDLYDSSKQDTDVVLLDRDAEAAVILSDWELAQAAKSGGVSLVLRFDGTKILNARLNAPGLDGTSVLPASGSPIAPQPRRQARAPARLLWRRTMRTATPSPAPSNSTPRRSQHRPNPPRRNPRSNPNRKPRRPNCRPPPPARLMPARSLPSWSKP